MARSGAPTQGTSRPERGHGAISMSARKTVTAICGWCEYEWNADKHDPDGNCPMCGKGADCQEHVIRGSQVDNSHTHGSEEVLRRIL
jgi:hypothetical protein